jgi:hypothetical protein
MFEGPTISCGRSRKEEEEEEEEEEENNKKEEADNLVKMKYKNRCLM